MNEIFAIGDAVKVLPNAVYVSGNKVSEDVINTKVFVRDIKNGNYVIAHSMKKGAALGIIPGAFLKVYTDENEAVIDPYFVKVPVDNFPVYQSFSKNSGVIDRINRGLFTIVNEKKGFGKVKIGPGWIELAKVEKLQ
jgi:hypothetical protein